MKFTRLILLTGLGIGLSACASVDMPTRNAPFEELPTGLVQAPEGYAPVPLAPAPVETVSRGTADFDAPALPAAAAAAPTSGSPVQGIRVHVPRSLEVSEANRFLPSGDIVWRGDPMGDRHAQVQAIFEAAMAEGVKRLSGPIQADLVVEVVRFHSLTEKARYFTGGVHAIEFKWALKDPETGAYLTQPRLVSADLQALGGRRAIQADQAGQTMRVRITDHLADVIVQEMTTAEGHRNAELGLIQRLNKI